jgi:SAM-dependent methyltransferase
MLESSVNMSLFGNDNSRTDKSGGVNLYFHAYNYFPYERELARLEIRQVSGIPIFSETSRRISLPPGVDEEKLRTLTYVAEIAGSDSRISTVQHELEEAHRKVAGTGKRQATRYSAHGLHEYKGRFNPQIVRFLLNYLGVKDGTKVLDPFCGSGTTLVETALRGIPAVGIDMNPLAVFLCNAKLHSLAIPAKEIESALHDSLESFRKEAVAQIEGDLDPRITYLKNWFPPDTVALLERLRACIRQHGGRAETVLLSLASDLLRDYSLQEPSDLRIRRRIAPLPTKPFLSVYEEKAASFLRNLAAAQKVTGLIHLASEAVIEDSRKLFDGMNGKALPSRYDFVITSPPYATALPYIDTQRLSLVWLGLCAVENIRRLDAEAVGSRETRNNEKDWQWRLAENADSLPREVASFCHKLQLAIGPEDGFRRKAMPTLIYRYFADMRKVFVALPKVLHKNAKLAFVVGPNQTTLGGRRFDINTPAALLCIAEQLGFIRQEVIPLQTYHRYGLHQKNSIRGESLTIMTCA